MRCLARIGLAALGLAFALAAPTIGRADYPAPAGAPGPGPQAQHQHRRNIFGQEVLCTDCQRARIKAKDGIDIPPPPPIPQPGVAELQSGRCEHCEQAAMTSASAGPVVSAPEINPNGNLNGIPVVSGPVVSGQAVMAPGPVVMAPGPVIPGGPVVAARSKRHGRGHDAPGHAVAGGEEPGRAVVGVEPGMSGEPAPIGVVRSRLASGGMPPQGQGGYGRSGAAPGDPAVTPSSFSPVTPLVSNRPHVLEHLIGISAIGRGTRESLERRESEKHARIAYGQKEATVTDVPASVVYKQR